MKKVVEQCYREAVKILKKNSTLKGFKASSSFYNSIWARDGAIILIGALLTDDKKLLKVSKKTIETLRGGQTELGQIPNVYYCGKRKYSYYSLDANLWWIISVFFYFQHTRDKKFLEDNWLALEKAMRFSLHHVIDETALIDQPESADWMDSSIGRKGKVLYTNCLFVKALQCMGMTSEILKKDVKFADADVVKKRINLLLWPEEKGKKYLCRTNDAFFTEVMNKWRDHYVDYLSFESFDNRCDVFANLLAILFEITNKDKEKRILGYLKRKHISLPYPVKVLWPPVIYPNPTWDPKVDLYRKEQNRNIPFCYHNGAIWPFVGGFYVAALVKSGKKTRAARELIKLAEANKLAKRGKWGFNEWLHGKEGKPLGASKQSWSAAAFIMAYKAVEGKSIW